MSFDNTELLQEVSMEINDQTTQIEQKSQKKLRKPLKNNQWTDQSDAMFLFNQQMFNDNYFQIQKFDLDNFKVYSCPIEGPHNHKQCLFYHNGKDRKRAGEHYDSDMCQYSETGDCPFGDLCLMSHNRVESFYRHGKYKTKFCSCFPGQISNCEYGDFCCFAHSDQELRVNQIHKLPQDDVFYKLYYKTVWCPFSNVTHERSHCVYAHNFQDLRRRVDLYSYVPEPCPNWNTYSHLDKYEFGCPNGRFCQRCHGWKEFEFHLSHYKVRVCVHGKKCQKKVHCPYLHNEEQNNHFHKQVIKPKVIQVPYDVPQQVNVVPQQFQQALTSINLNQMLIDQMMQTLLLQNLITQQSQQVTKYLNIPLSYVLKHLSNQVKQASISSTPVD